jgi:hypothetical protein
VRPSAIVFAALLACDPNATSCVPASPGAGPADTTIGEDAGETAVADTSGGVDGEVDAGDAGNGWVYEAVPAMKCGGGGASGVGISRGSDPTKVVVLMAGGGACWDAFTCFAVGSANYLEVAWDAPRMRADLQPVEASGLFERSDADSPYRDATWLLVPYCTGDLHVGAAVRYYNPDFEPQRATHHVGDANLAAALAHVGAETADADDVWVLGVSAGGYGAQLQAHRFRQQWPAARLTILADGAPMVQPGEGRWGLWRNAWDAQLPPGCDATCASSVRSVLAHQVAALPEVPFALATFADDGVITVFFAQPLGGLASAQGALFAALYRDDERLSMFWRAGTEHVLFDKPWLTAADGTRFDDWYWRWARHEPLHDAR